MYYIISWCMKYDIMYILNFKRKENDELLAIIKSEAEFACPSDETDIFQK